MILGNIFGQWCGASPSHAHISVSGRFLPCRDQKVAPYHKLCIRALHPMAMSRLQVLTQFFYNQSVSLMVLS